MPRLVTGFVSGWGQGPVFFVSLGNFGEGPEINR